MLMSAPTNRPSGDFVARSAAMAINPCAPVSLRASGTIGLPRICVTSALSSPPPPKEMPCSICKSRTGSTASGTNSVFSITILTPATRRRVPSALGCARYETDAGLARAWHQPTARLDAVLPPDSPARERADCGPLRDPQKQQAVIDYFTWLHTTMADALLTLAATVKKSWPRPIVTAAFQGYFYGQFGRNAAGSHLAMDKVLASPHLDCFCSPQSYTEKVRAMGGSGHARGILGSVRRAGKLWLDENDHGTFLVGCPWDKKFATTPADDIACLRRNTLQAVLRGGGQWWYDFGMVAGTPAFASRGNVGWWDDSRLSQEIAAIHRVAQACHAYPFTRPADTLVIHDPWSFCHTVAQRWSLEGFKFGAQPPVGPNPFSARGMDGLLEGLYRSGLVFDEALIGELATMDISPFRLIIFGTTPILTEAQRQLITTQIATGGRHLALTGYARLVRWTERRRRPRYCAERHSYDGARCHCPHFSPTTEWRHGRTNSRGPETRPRLHRPSRTRDRTLERWQRERGTA